MQEHALAAARHPSNERVVGARGLAELQLLDLLRPAAPNGHDDVRLRATPASIEPRGPARVKLINVHGDSSGPCRGVVHRLGEDAERRPRGPRIELQRRSVGHRRGEQADRRCRLLEDDAAPVQWRQVDLRRRGRRRPPVQDDMDPDARARRRDPQ